MKIFGRQKAEQKQPKPAKPEFTKDAKYISGHPLFPHEKDTHIAFYADKMIVGAGGIVIPYGRITKLGSQEDKRITKTRVFFTGVVAGLLWKKIYRYTVIEYNDGISDLAVIFDLHKNAEKLHPYIYGKMLEARSV